MTIKEKTYDRVYGDKENTYETTNGVTASLFRKLRRFEINRYQSCLSLLTPGKERLLDLGCGDGEFLFMAEHNFKECYGVDVSNVRIQRAKAMARKRQNKSKFRFYQCDMDEGLPFDYSYFDAVSCLSVLEHVFSPPNVLDEIRRVLRPGGIFVVQVPNIAWMPYRFQLLSGRLPVTGGACFGVDWEHLHNFTKSILCSLLRIKGFEIETVSCGGVFAKLRRWWLSLLGSDIIVKARKAQKP